jgi:hypothetical protein
MRIAVRARGAVDKLTDKPSGQIWLGYDSRLNPDHLVGRAIQEGLIEPESFPFLSVYYSSSAVSESFV